MQRAIRRRELRRFSGWQLAGLILDYNLVLAEDSDPVRVILDHEFASAGNLPQDSRVQHASGILVNPLGGER